MGYLSTQQYFDSGPFFPMDKGCDISRNHGTGSRTSAQTAGGKMKGVIWDLMKDIESVINKNGNKPSEKRRCVCRFCENPFQGGPNVFQAHHRVYGTGKKTVKLCKSTFGGRQGEASTAD